MCINTCAIVLINQYSAGLFVSYSRKNPIVWNYFLIYLISFAAKMVGPFTFNKSALNWTRVCQLHWKTQLLEKSKLCPWRYCFIKNCAIYYSNKIGIEICLKSLSHLLFYNVKAQSLSLVLPFVNRVLCCIPFYCLNLWMALLS